VSAQTLFFRGKDILRIIRSFQISDSEDFAFATFAAFFFQAKLDNYFFLAYQHLFADETILVRPSYYYGLRILLSGKTPGILNWKKKYPEEVETLWKWNDEAALADMLSDTKKMLDIFSSIDL